MNLPGPSDAPAAPELHRDVDVDERAARRAVERRDREAGGSATGPDVPQHAGRNTRRSGRVLVQAQRHPETARVVRRPVGVAARIAIRALRHAPAGGGAVDLELGVAIGPRIVATRDPRCRRRDDEREHGEQRGGRQPVLLQATGERPARDAEESCGVPLVSPRQPEDVGDVMGLEIPQRRNDPFAADVRLLVPSGLGRRRVSLPPTVRSASRVWEGTDAPVMPVGAAHDRACRCPVGSGRFDTRVRR